MSTTRLFLATCIVALLLALVPCVASAGVVTRPIDPKQQTGLAFGDRSHWLQPWRGYLDTPPATRLRDAIGINFNVSPEEAPATAALLGRSGFRRARVEFGWDQMDYANPSRLKDPGRINHYLSAMRKNGIRPLILLNANHGGPGPMAPFTARLQASARRGDRRVLLDTPSARAVVPGKSGLDDVGNRRADVILTSVDGQGWATLSRPLPRDLAAGEHPATTLRYAPFGPPKLRDGRPNPRFQETLQGWLMYVAAITRQARTVMGGNDFDVEIWNELTFGSDFLYQDRYYDPPRESGDGDVTEAIRDATVRFLRSPASPARTIGIGDGFANQQPWATGVKEPAGLTAIDKHPYNKMRRFPGASQYDGITPLDALRRPSYSGPTARRRDSFVPRYDAFFPEYTLSAIQTEHVVRDISPITTDVYGTPHGRRVRPKGGRAPQVWITEAGMDTDDADPPGDHLSPADVQHLQAKAALRYYTSFANKGVAAVHLFGAKGPGLQLIDQGFYDAIRNRQDAYPGDAAGGDTTTAVARLTETLSGAQRGFQTHPLSLDRIAESHNHRQFGGGGGAGLPPLYNRDVLGFFPFQLRPHEYVASVYVMTRNMAKPYLRGSAPTRYDMPPERYTLTIGGLTGARVSASATDPMTGDTIPVRAQRLGAGRVRVSLPVTDSPRMLRLVEGGAGTAVSLKVRHRRLARRGRQIFTGRVRSANSTCPRRLALSLSRWSKKRRGWRHVNTVGASSARAGRFTASARLAKRGRYRARATTVGRGCARARSRAVAFRVQ